MKIFRIILVGVFAGLVFASVDFAAGEIDGLHRTVKQFFDAQWFVMWGYFTARYWDALA